MAAFFFNFLEFMKRTLDINSSNHLVLRDLKDLVMGEGFMVTINDKGFVQVYDKKFRLLAQNTFEGVGKIDANSRVIMKFNDGSISFYDRFLNLQFNRIAS
jgi:hypothetical protein